MPTPASFSGRKAETRRARRYVDLRREVPVLVPTAVLLLVVLSTFTLVSYRNAVHLLIEQRQWEAERLATTIARQLDGERLPDSTRLGEFAPQAVGIAVIGPDGHPQVHTGETSQPLPVHQAETHLHTFGPSEDVPGLTVALVPLGEGRWLRLDLPALILDAQRRGLRVLTVLVLMLNVALSTYILLLLRQLMLPYQTLLERAREIGPRGREKLRGDEEVNFLLDTFEQALRALSHREGSGRDGDGEREADEDLQVLERTLLASVESGLLLLDRAGDVLAINRVGESLLHVARPEAGTPLSEALAPHSRLAALLLDAAQRQQELQRQECTVQVDDEIRTLGLAVHPLRRDDGRVRGYLVLFADLTEMQQQAAEERLAESLARLGELAGGIAHEMRNSLATLRGYLALIERKPEEESLKDYLREIRHETDHLQRVLEDFLSFARPGTVRLEPLLLAQLIHRAAADPALAGMPVRVLSEEPGQLKGDPQLLERALRNLLHNAAEAHRDSGCKGPVEVSLVRNQQRLEVLIDDRGPGLPAGVRERLFEPFAAGRRSGVGLGLALAHRILALHGARLQLEDREGGGTRARLQFPKEAANSATEGNNSRSESGALELPGDEIEVQAEEQATTDQ